jgi:RNA polymerase sigma-70 factor (ECF subfamily)
MAAPRDLARWYDEHAQALFAFLLNLTRNEADTRDLLQAAVRDERGFLLRMAHNLAVDLVRRRDTRARNYEAFAAEAVAVFAPAADADEQVFRARLTEALGELPVEQRAVVHLKLWEGLTFEAIAELLDVPLNTAASRYRYGLDKLRERLRPLYEEIR